MLVSLASATSLSPFFSLVDDSDNDWEDDDVPEPTAAKPKEKDGWDDDDDEEETTVRFSPLSPNVCHQLSQRYSHTTTLLWRASS